MTRLEDLVFPTLWIAWGAYWWAAARDVKSTVRHEPFGSRLLHLVPLAVAAALLAVQTFPALPWLNARWVPATPWTVWIGAAMLAGGLAFTVWARRTLGRNWSATVTLKQDHALVVEGPYRLVRHPIYTGLLLGFAGSALARGDARGILVVVIVVLALWRKLRLEERWMVERFGADYDDYRRRVPALVPFVR